MNLTKATTLFIKLNAFIILELMTGCSGGGSEDGQIPGANETNANISSIQLSSGVLNFDPDKTTYNVEVGTVVSSLSFTVILANTNASFVINGTKVESGKPYDVALSVGQNTIQIMVTADDGKTTKDYTVVVNRLAEKSHNPDLSGLILSQGTLNPAFDATKTSYTAEMLNSISSFSVTPTAAGVNASITVNGISIASGVASGSIPLAIGANTITVVITAEDGTTTKTYNLVVTRLSREELSHDDNLSNLTINQGILIPGFQSNYLSYTSKVDNSITSITVTPTAAGVNATIKVNGVTVISSSPTQVVALNVGANTITVVVTAEDGSSTKTYTITVTRSNGVLDIWTWISGDNMRDQIGVYGTKGISADSNKPGARNFSVSWIDTSGNLWLFGGRGYNSAGILFELNDLWKFDGTNWTWVSGDSTVSYSGVYGTKGVAADSNKPRARHLSVSWRDSSGNLWLFGGFGQEITSTWVLFNDLWKFDGTNWTWVSGDNIVDQSSIYGTKGVAADSNKPGARAGSISWVDSSDNLWLFGGNGYGSTGVTGYLNDLWKFNGTNWTWVSGDNTIDQSSIYGTKGVAVDSNKPGARAGSISWVDSNGNLWLFGGGGWNSTIGSWVLNDLWRFDGTYWTWISGDNTTNQIGDYGTRGVAVDTNKPGARKYGISWVDSSGNLWLFGGDGYDSTGDTGYLNDLWKFDGTNWTWVSGDNTVDQSGIYGTKGVAVDTNKPGARIVSTSWVDKNNDLWLFGGYGYSSTGVTGYFNDLWKYEP